MQNPLRSLATRITLLVLAATLASSMAVSWISLQSLDAFFRRKVDQRFPEITRRIADELEHWYDLRGREIEVFAASTILAEAMPQLGGDGPRGRRARAEAEEYLRYVLASFPHFERIVLAGPDGHRLMQVGGDEPLPAGLLARPADRAASTWISGARAMHGEMVQVATTPMRDAWGRALGELHAVIDLARLDGILASRELGDSARVFLVDDERRVLSPPQAIGEEGLYTGPMPTPASQGLSAAVRHDPRLDMRVVGTQSPFPHFGWSLVVEQPYDDAFAPVVASMRRAIALNVAIVLVCGLGAFRIAGSIVQPLRALAEAARRLSEGERRVEVAVADSGSAEEIHQLTTTFNEMSRALARFRSELEDNHRALETANEELVAKNETLSEMNLVLEQLSITDGLTKLHNHRYFQEAMRKACKRSERTGDPLCLLLIDIDYFKRWNDRLGHAAGDEILRRIAERLGETIRETDLLARYGGEEFAVLADDTDLAGAAALAEKLRQSVIEASFLTDVPSERDVLTVSIGVARFRGDRKRLFAEADAALYRAKDAGRDRVEVTHGTGEPGGEP